MTGSTYRNCFVALLLVLSLILIGGCSTFGTQTVSKTTPEESVSKDAGPSPMYYDFGDVLVPSELEINKEKSFVFRTPGLSAGVLSLKGRVEINSLITFFETNMAKDNWRPVSAFKSPRSVLLFQKENRWCVISVTEESFNTYVEIWVSPTIAGVELDTGGGLLK